MDHSAGRSEHGNGLTKTRSLEWQFTPRRCAAVGVALVGILSSAGLLTTIRPVQGASPSKDSVAVRMGPDVAVPLNEESGALVEEPSVALRDSVVVVAWNDSHGGHRVRGRHDIGTAVSVDGGRTFRSLGFVPDSTRIQLPVGSDPRLVADERGAFFLETVGETTDGTHLLVLFTLEPPRYAGWRELTPVAQAKRVLDKPAFGSGAGRLMTAFTRDSAIVMSVSEDAGRTWSQPRAVSSAGAQPRSGTALAVCGREAWIAWADTKTVPWDEIWIAHSRDGGATFDPAILHYPLKQTVKPPLGYSLGPGPDAFIQNDVALTCFASPGELPRVQLSAVEGVSDSAGRPTRSRILRWERRLGSDQWAGPKDITYSDGLATRVFPGAAATSSTVATLFYEHNIHGTRTQVDVILLVEDSAGHRSRVRLSDQATDWVAIKGDNAYSPGQHNFGDYISLTTDGVRYAAAWTDGRDGRTRIHVRIVDAGELR